MWNSFRYALLTSAIAYVIITFVLFLYGFAQTGWSRIDSDVGSFLLGGVTLVLSEFPFWGSFSYLAVLVPWLGSSLVLIVLISRWGDTSKKRRLFAGTGIGVYYLIMMLVFIGGKIITSWGHIDVNPGDFAYALFLIWPLGGFGVGYLSALITDKILKIQVTARP
jgi:uncharacterized membrane protein